MKKNAQNVWKIDAQPLLKINIIAFWIKVSFGIVQSAIKNIKEIAWSKGTDWWHTFYEFEGQASKSILLTKMFKERDPTCIPEDMIVLSIENS